MARINEHVFKINGVEYRLTYYSGDKPRIFKDDAELQLNISELLRKYLCELRYEFEQLIGKTTQQLASMTLSHFSNKKEKIGKSLFSQKTTEIKKVKGFSQKTNFEEKLELSQNFKVVMICSSGKYASTLDDYPQIIFKAIGNLIDEFHPDENMPNSAISWRDYLMEHQNDKNLLKAYQLYTRIEYQCLYEKFGNSFYILSAGWGLVSSEFKLPNYDITFSNNANMGAERNTNINNLPIYNDFNQLVINDNEDIIFIGSASYLPHFYSLTYNLPNRKLIFFFGQGNNLPQPMVNQNTFEFINFPSLNNRSWHYELANLLCEDINSI